MNELIKITNQVVGTKNIETVNARELHTFIESKQQFTTWIKNRISEYDFVENKDFICVSQKNETQRGDGQTGVSVSNEYYITLDMAKELAMVERNEKGKQARKYFIECEKKLRQELPSSYLEALEKLVEQEKERLSLSNQVDNITSSRNKIRGQLGGTTKQLNQVKSMTGASKNEATINKVKSVTGIKYDWRSLNQWCVDNDIVPRLISLNDYDNSQVKLYPAQAWYDVYGLELFTLFN